MQNVNNGITYMMKIKIHLELPNATMPANVMEKGFVLTGVA
jgi:hypothetical protein